MILVRHVLILLVALLHIYFLVLEMFFWTRPLGLKTFRMSLQQANDRAVLAANLGLYNGFLSAGLIWSVCESDSFFAQKLAMFFLLCVIVAAIYGAYSVHRKILYIQGAPAVLALLVTLCV